MSKLKRQFILSVTALILFSFGIVPLQPAKSQEIAGTFFGNPVPKENYMFILRIILSYHSPWGGIPKDREQTQKRVWDELILSYEAHQRQISVDEESLKQKITETLEGEGVDFNWQEEPQAYEEWVRETLNAPVVLFENQMKHLVQIKALHQQIKDGINITPTDDEIMTEFLNENNSLSVELAEFDTKEEAETFYALVTKDLEEWDQAKKRDDQLIPEDRRFRRPGFVALEFLMDMWQFPRDAVYDMMEMEKDDIYPPQPVYKGYGVFRVLDIRKADMDRYEKRKERIVNQLQSRAKYDGFKNWLENLRKRADIQIYMEPPEGIFP